jgi:DNA primase
MNNFIVELLGRFLGECRGVNEKSGQLRFDCPKCSEIKGIVGGDGKGNLEVNVNEGVFNCWSCGETHGTRGNIDKLFWLFANRELYNEYKELYSDDHISYLAKEGINDKNKVISLPKEYIELDKKNIKKNGFIDAFNYLVTYRGLNDLIIKRYKIGYCNSGKYKGRIILPSFDVNGNVNFFTSRAFHNIKPKYLNEKIDKRTIIFNEYFINWDANIYLVEGPFDHIVVPNSIPLLGKVLLDEIFIKINDRANSDVIIFLDGDAYENSLNIYKKLSSDRLYGRIKIIKLKMGLDPSLIFKKYGSKGIFEALKSAEKVSFSKIF